MPLRQAQADHLRPSRTLGPVQALRYRGCAPRSGAGAHLFAVATRRGVAPIAGQPGHGGSSLRALRAGAASRSFRAQATHLARKRYARGPDRALTHSARAGARDRSAMARARTQGGQSRLAAHCPGPRPGGTRWPGSPSAQPKRQPTAALVPAPPPRRDGYARIAPRGAPPRCEGLSDGERAVRTATRSFAGALGSQRSRLRDRVVLAADARPHDDRSRGPRLADSCAVRASRGRTGDGHGLKRLAESRFGARGDR